LTDPGSTRLCDWTAADYGAATVAMVIVTLQSKYREISKTRKGGRLNGNFCTTDDM
jgi:hypothetical protein